MISTSSCPSNLAEHEGDRFTFDYFNCWRGDTHGRKQGALGIKGQPQVWRSAYHGNKGLGKPAAKRQVVGGKRGRGRRGAGAGGPKFRPTRAATGVNTLQVGDSNNNNNNNKVGNCHPRSSKAATTKTTITTKKTTTTSRRQAHNICTQKFKHDCWLLAASAAAATVGKGGKRAVGTATDCDNKLRQRDPHRRGSRRSGKASHHARCDNNNLYHQPQHHSSSSSSSSAWYHHHPQNHKPLGLAATFTANSRAAHQSRWVPATGRQFKVSYNCSSLGRRGEGNKQSTETATGGTVLPVSGSNKTTSLPFNSAEPSLRRPTKTTTFTTPITETHAPITSRTASSGSSHKPLHSCLSYPQVPDVQSRVGPVVVALPFTWASSSSPASSPQSAVARESRGSRSSSVCAIATNRPMGQCRSTKAAEYDPTTATNVQDDVQKSTSSSATKINCKSRLSMKPEDHRDKTTMTSSKPSMTSITNDHLVAATTGAQSPRASGHHRHHRANNRAHNNIIKPLVPRHNNKPLLETPSTPPIISTMQQLPAHRAHQQQQRSNPSSRRGANESPGQPARNHRASPSVSQSELPTVSKPSRGGKGSSPAISHQPDSVAHQTASLSTLVMAQDVNNNKLPDELQANVHSLESVGQRARMAISIYDPLPAKERQEPSEECHSEQRLNLERPSSPSIAVNRPTNLNLNGLGGPAGNMSLSPRRRPPRRRESLYGDRFLKSPTIPEEPSELSALGDEELAALSQQVKIDLRTTGQQDQRTSEPMMEGFLVATIEPEWGGVSKTLVIHSNATIENLTQDVLKRLIEIEHDHQSSARARMRGAPGVHPREKATTGRRNRAGLNDMSKLQELECEAEKLAKMFKQQLEIQQQQRALESSSFRDNGDPTLQQKSDPTAMSRDEQARFFNPDPKSNERHKPKCVDKQANDDTGDHDQDDDYTVRVLPSKLGSPIEDVLTDELNLRLANKVVLNVGLVICLNDIVNVGESYLHCGDGAIFTKCTFRMIVFRPQIGEIICGTLRSSSKEGLNISLGLFDSILIPPQHLNEPSHFNEADQTWTWIFEDEGQQHNMRLDVGKQIKFRIHSEQFVDVSPHGPSAVQAKPNDPYTIVGSICESGLGLVEWWV